MTRPASLIVLAKAPVAGRSKTRLTPPCTPPQAAELAEAALRDSCAAVASVDGTRHVLVLEGAPGAWLPAGFDVIPQCNGGLGDRLAHAFASVPGPALLVGMDTPQITGDLLRASLDTLAQPAVDVVLGPAVDGGFWAIGFKQAAPAVFRDVPMSSADTLLHQRRRLAELALRVADLPTLRDVDTISDADDVAAQAPSSHFATALARLTLDTAVAS